MFKSIIYESVQNLGIYIFFFNSLNTCLLPYIAERLMINEGSLEYDKYFIIVHVFIYYNMLYRYLLSLTFHKA